jgi:hypothetical protein
MSNTAINFKASLLIGEQSVPLASEIAIGDTQSQDGVNNGFLFKLDRQSEDPPVTIYLGDVINFIETKLGASDLSQSPDMGLITQAFPSLTAANFNSSNQTMVNVYEFSINSSTKEFLFSFNFDVEGSDPSTGLIALPGDLNNWLKIESLSIAFSATTSSSTPSQQPPSPTT